MSDLKWHLERGQIIVNSIHHVVDSETLHVFELDLHSKYAETFTSMCGTGLTFFLSKGEHTLKTDDSQELATYFSIELDNEDWLWMPLAEAPRYTARFVAWKRPGCGEEGLGKMIYQSETDNCCK